MSLSLMAVTAAVDVCLFPVCPPGGRILLYSPDTPSPPSDSFYVQFNLETFLFIKILKGQKVCSNVMVIIINVVHSDWPKNSNLLWAGLS